MAVSDFKCFEWLEVAGKWLASGWKWLEVASKLLSSVYILGKITDYVYFSVTEKQIIYKQNREIWFCRKNIDSTYDFARPTQVVTGEINDFYENRL